MNNWLSKIFRKLAILALLAGLPLFTQASIDVYEFEDDATREQFVSLTKELRCPKCQNQDIADSNAPIAADMRKEVHRLLQEGQDREEIVDHMIERFGDFVTYKPRLSAETFMLWYGPWLFVILGLLIIATMIRMKKPETQSSRDSMSAEPENNNTQASTSQNAKRSGIENTYSSEVKKLLDKYDEKD